MRSALAEPHHSGAVRLVAAAASALSDAAVSGAPAERYAAAHLSALRAAAAVLAVRAHPALSAARRPTSAWSLLAEVAPEFSEWAAYFAAGAGKRAAADAGLSSAVSRREADDLLRDALTFMALVETTVGVLPLATTVGRVG